LSPPPQKVCKLKLARSSYCCRPVLGILETVPPDSEKMTVAVTSFRHSGAGTVISAFLKNCRRVASGSPVGANERAPVRKPPFAAIDYYVNGISQRHVEVLSYLRQ
jgi:hypothetical protein